MATIERVDLMAAVDRMREAGLPVRDQWVDIASDYADLLDYLDSVNGMFRYDEIRHIEKFLRIKIKISTYKYDYDEWRTAEDSASMDDAMQWVEEEIEWMRNGHIEMGATVPYDIREMTEIYDATGEKVSEEITDTDYGWSEPDEEYLISRAARDNKCCGDRHKDHNWSEVSVSMNGTCHTSTDQCDDCGLIHTSVSYGDQRDYDQYDYVSYDGSEMREEEQVEEEEEVEEEEANNYIED